MNLLELQVLKRGQKESYGKFKFSSAKFKPINTLIDFIIIAFVLFMLIRMMNRMHRKKEEAPAEPTTKDCPYCFSSIPIKATRCPNCTSEITAPAT